MTDRETSTVRGALTLDDRRAFMRLPVEERRRLLAEQADRMVEFYESTVEKADRNQWQEGDIVEY